MEHVRACIVAAGINCDLETEQALRLAGSWAERIHINRLMAEPALLDGVQILVFPGGFSYGDDVAAGKILANQVVHHLRDILHRFVEQGKLVLGICNGFQVLIKTGLVPGLRSDAAALATDYPATLTDNDCGRFEDRWIYLQPGTERCVFLEPGGSAHAHGEGKIVARPLTLARLRMKAMSHFAVDADGCRGAFPVNPNGSDDDIAALTDPTGRVLGMMPHPERFVRLTQHPHWTRLKEREGFGDGMTIFNNAVKYVHEHFS